MKTSQVWIPKKVSDAMSKNEWTSLLCIVEDKNKIKYYVNWEEIVQELFTGEMKDIKYFPKVLSKSDKKKEYKKFTSNQ